MTADVVADARPGALLNDPGFASTSYRMRKAADFADRAEPVIIRIGLPRGTQGVQMSGVGMSDFEKEFLLPRDSWFRVTRVRTMSIREFERTFGRLPRDFVMFPQSDSIRVVEAVYHVRGT